ncbi:MAG TPA: hypothetical protein VGH42_13790, partial [Verrucomicrobiae bacterium]
MKRIPEHNSRKETQNKSASDLKGFTELGMKREALKLARHKLKQINITAKDFSEALNAILIQADKCKSWTPIIEAAYAHLSKRDKQTVRCWMLYFYNSIKNHEIANRFIPSRFTSKCELAELAFAGETWIALNKMNEMDKLAKKLLWAFKVAEQPMMQALLGCDKKLNLGKATQKEGIICRECAWSALSDGLKPSRMVANLFDCLGDLGVAHFQLMKIKNIRVKPHLGEAINTILIINVIKKTFKFRGEYDASHDSDNSWHLGFDISSTGNSGNKSLTNITGINESSVGWFGFQCSPDSEPQCAVWLYCSDENHANQILEYL